MTPAGLGSSWFGEIPNSGVRLIDNGQVLCEARYAFEEGATQRGYFRVWLQPTARLQPTASPVAPSGVWTIRLDNVSLEAAQSVHAWIQRDDTPYGYPIRGRQSYFDEPCYVRFDAQGKEIEEDTHPDQLASPWHVKRDGSINALATGAQTIVAGGYRRKELAIARYSSGGPITPPAGGALPAGLRKPDATLVSDDSKVHAGVLAAGSRSGSRVAISGTSVAAPTLALWIADELAAGNPGDRAAVCDEAEADEIGLPGWEPDLPPERGGCGRMRRERPIYRHERLLVPE